MVILGFKLFGFVLLGTVLFEIDELLVELFEIVSLVMLGDGVGIGVGEGITGSGASSRNHHCNHQYNYSAENIHQVPKCSLHG